MTLIIQPLDDCFNDFPFTIFFSALLVGSHVDSAGLLRTLLHCCWPPAQALPGHCWLLIGPLAPSRSLIGSWPSSRAPLTSAGAGDTRLSGERGASSSSGRLAWIHNYGTITLPSGPTLTTYPTEILNTTFKVAF